MKVSPTTKIRGQPSRRGEKTGRLPAPPSVIHPRPASQPSPVPSAAPGRRGHHPRILVVDDDPSVRESLMAVLVDEGYLVLPAVDGTQALALAAVTLLDLVLLDLNLAGQNGWETFERLTSEHPTLPVIIVTARSNQLFTALGAGAGALLEKPLDIPMLLQTIARLLAEPPEMHLERLAGHKTNFFYSAGQPDRTAAAEEPEQEARGQRQE